MKNYKKGDIAYMSMENGRACRPVKYTGRFKDRFDMPGWVYYFKPIDDPKPYMAIHIDASELDGVTTELIPFRNKPYCYGKVRR